jgi:DNA-binding transcriptional ArsR family regulator
MPGLSMQAMQRAAEMLRLLAHPVRLKLVELLVAHPHTVGELAAMVRQPPNAVSQHLMKMKVAGILRREPRGRRVYYTVAHAGAIGVLRAIGHHEHIHTSYEGGEAI